MVAGSTSETEIIESHRFSFLVYGAMACRASTVRCSSAICGYLAHRYARTQCQPVGWMERSDTHQLHFADMMGFARLNPSYVLFLVADLSRPFSGLMQVPKEQLKHTLAPLS